MATVTDPPPLPALPKDPEGPSDPRRRAGRLIRARHRTMAAGRAVRRTVGTGVSAIRRRRLLRWVVIAAVLAAGTLVAVDAASASPTYPLDANFSKAPGLFAGASVEVLGVRVGTVSAVRNVGDKVVVAMQIEAPRPIPAAADASLVEPELLGEPDIDLAPGYTGGPVLASGATIPEARTAEPVSTEQLLKSLQRTLSAINPHAVGNLITNLAQDLNGQGKGLNKLIASAAGTIQLLAEQGDDLGKLNGSLAQLTGRLDSRTSQITQLITDYDTVSGVVAQHSSQLGDSITQLSQASTQLVQLLTPNLGSLEQDVGTVTTVGRTLDRNLGSVDQIFTSATSLFSAAERAYTPTYNWLNLNLQLPAGVTGAYVAGLIRDRLAGVCRRISANHSTGQSVTELQTLQQCGNPSSGFFNPIVDQIPTILNDIASGKAPTTTASPASMLQQGLSEIPGVSQATQQPATAPTTTPTTTTATAPPTTTTAPSSGSGGSGSTPCLGGLLGSVVTCSSGSTGSSSSSGSSSTTTTSSGLGGLLSYRQPVTTSSDPSLTPAAEDLLPPLPPSAPGAGTGSGRRTGSHKARKGKG